jgi:uncharacterized membrane protein (DUF4010 family)
MTDDTLILRFAIALGIGLVVGVERGWREREAPAGSRTAGVRTYGLSALLGAVFAALADLAGSWALLAVAFAVYAGLFAWFKRREAVADGVYSVTGVVAGLLVFALGALAVAGEERAAAAGGVATAGLLASREVLHGLLRRLTWAELRSALLLAAMTVVVLPLLPDRAVDPWGGANPREIWTFTVLTAALSYAGYVAVRVAGPRRGILLGALAGALVSSTAVTVVLARRAAAGAPSGLMAGGAALAGMVSIARVLVLAGIAAPAVLPSLLPAALAAAAVFGLCGAVLVRGPAPEGEADPQAGLGNPFDLLPLLAFAAGFAVVAVAGGWLTERFGSGGLFGAAAVLGMVDVDVAVLSTARQVGGAVDAATGAGAILLTLAVNAVARVVYAAAAGPLPFAARLAGATALSIAAGLAVLRATGGWAFAG